MSACEAERNRATCGKPGMAVDGSDQGRRTGTLKG